METVNKTSSSDNVDCPIIEEIVNESNESNESNKEQEISESSQKVLSAEERKKFLKSKLRQKISGKRTNRTVGLNRKKSENLNDSMQKITEVLANKNINSPDQIDSKLIETVMNILNKQDLELLIDKLKDNTVFKELLNKLQDKYSE